jgi:UDP-N-acetylmuramyl tripeptide synthase
MLISGIIYNDYTCKTADLVNSFFATTGKMISIVDFKNLKELDSMRIKSYINELQKNNIEILILKIDIFDIKADIFGYLRFDIIIISDKPENLNKINMDIYKDIMNKVFSLLDEKGTAIVNVDDKELLQVLQGIKHNIVTYGFNSKASMTTSSVGDRELEDVFMCCLQKNISSKNGLVIEPQEYRLKLRAHDIDAYNILAAATFAILNGVDLNYKA